MLVTRCSRCGKPARASLATPDAIRCDACGYSGPPADDAKPILRAARDHLIAQDARARQVSASRQEALTRGGAKLFAAIFFVASLPCDAVFFGAIRRSFASSGPHPSAAAVVMACFTFALLWAIGGFGYAAIKRAQKQLRAACAAVPPARVGDPAMCRVCGGDLAAGGAFVRCGFCGTDNFADARVIATLEKRETDDASDYALSLSREVTSTREIASGAAKLAPIVAVVVPIGCLILLSAITPLLERIERPLDDSVRYAIAMTRDGECIGHPIAGDDGDYEFEFGVRTEFPGKMGKSSPPTFSAATLVGKEMRAFLDGATPEFVGTVERVYGSPVGNLAILKNGADSVRVDVRALCVKTGKVDLLLKDVPTFTIRGDDMFWPNSGTVDRSKLEETKVDTLTEVDGIVTAIGSSDDAVFYSTGRDLFSAPIRGGNATRVARLDEKEWVLDLAASARGNVVCGTSSPFEAIVFFSGEKQPIRVPFSYLSLVTARGDDIFVAGADHDGNGVFRIERDGKVVRVASGLCHAIAADDAALYCGLDRSIERTDLASGETRTIFELPTPWPESKNETIAALAIDGDDVFFSFDGKVARVSKRGGIAHVVMDDLAELGPELFVTSKSIFLDMHPDRKFGGGEVVSFPKTVSR